jgi:hypothetical protein
MPASTLLSGLSAAGVLERPGSRRGAFLRVTPRFLDHAEATAARMRMTGRGASPAVVLHAALAGWDDYRQDPYQGALLLVDFLDGRGQLGNLQPVFPALEHFAQAAA